MLSGSVPQSSARCRALRWKYSFRARGCSPLPRNNAGIGIFHVKSRLHNTGMVCILQLTREIPTLPHMTDQCHSNAFTVSWIVSVTQKRPTHWFMLCYHDYIAVQSCLKRAPRVGDWFLAGQLSSLLSGKKSLNHDQYTQTHPFNLMFIKLTNAFMWEQQILK